MNGNETVLVNLIYLFQAILFTLHKPDLILKFLDILWLTHGKIIQVSYGFIYLSETICFVWSYLTKSQCVTHIVKAAEQ